MKTIEAKKIIAAMEHEIERTIDHLVAPGHPRPYFLSYLLREKEDVEIWGRYGSIHHSRHGRKRTCYTDIRVGKNRYDQVTGGGLDDNSEEAESHDYIDFPLETEDENFRYYLWRLTDAKYREAVKRYHDRKSRDVSVEDPNKKLTSRIISDPEQTFEPVKALKFDRKKIESFVKKASLVFKEFDQIMNGYVEYGIVKETKIFCSSEGVQRIWQQSRYELSAFMWLHTKRCSLERTHLIMTGTAEELPTLAEFKKQIISKVKEMQQVEAGGALVSYAGPVLLTGQAAGLLFHEVLGHRLEGSRLLNDDEGRTFRDKVGQQITHSGLSVYDDPTMKSYFGQSLAGHYTYDDEGSESDSSCLIENGILKGFLSTRSPLPIKSVGPNGHARSESFQRPISRMGNLIIKSEGGEDWEALKERLVMEVRRRRLSYGIILYDLEGGETGTESYDFQAFLGEVIVAKKISRNGKESFIRGVDVVGTPLASINQILAIGNSLTVHNSYCGAESGTIPVSTISPAILTANMELQAKDLTRYTPFRLPLPWFE